MGQWVEWKELYIQPKACSTTNACSFDIQMTKPRTRIGFVNASDLASQAAESARVNLVGKSGAKKKPLDSRAISGDDQELSMAAVKALRARFAPKDESKTSWL